MLFITFRVALLNGVPYFLAESEAKRPTERGHGSKSPERLSGVENVKWRAPTRSVGRPFKPQTVLRGTSERYRYRNFCSDLAGVHIEAHSGDILKLARVVRNWLRTNQEVEEIIPSGDHIFERYKQFLAKLPQICERFRLNPKAIIFRDCISVLEAWLLEHDWRAPQRPERAACQSSFCQFQLNRRSFAKNGLRVCGCTRFLSDTIIKLGCKWN
jgi:hypothetical protein